MAESAGDKDSRWYFTAEQLQNSPSRKCGIDADKELVYRQQTAHLIQEMGQALRVSQLCINTAIVYMHRFYAFHSFSHFNRHGIGAASLFLAAKVEEQPRKLEHVIRAANTCLNIEAPDPSKESFSEQAQDLVFNENVLLQTLGFDVAIDHPHTHVVKTCHLVKACKDLAQTSYFMASNSLHLTTMCLQYKPTVVACFCIHLACRWSNWDIPHSSEGLPWFHYVDKTVTKELLTQLTEEFIQIYDKSPSRLKNKLNSIKILAQSAKPDDARSGSGSGGGGGSQERSNHHRTSSTMSHSHHHKQQQQQGVDPKGIPSSSRQQHYQQMHHQGKSRERPIVPPVAGGAAAGDGGMKSGNLGGSKNAIQGGGSTGHSSRSSSLAPPRDAFVRGDATSSSSLKGSSRPSFQHHPPSGTTGFPPPHRGEQQKPSSSSSSAQSTKSGQYQQSGYFGDPTRSHQGNASQSMRYSQNSHKHTEFQQQQQHQKNQMHPNEIKLEDGQQNSENNSETAGRHPQKSIFSPDQPEKMEVMKKPSGEDFRKSGLPPGGGRFDERRVDMKKEKRMENPSSKTLQMAPSSGDSKKAGSVKPLAKHAPYGQQQQQQQQPYKSSSSINKRSFEEMTRHEDSGIDFREAKMRRSEAENESRAARAAGKMDSMSTMNPLNLGGSFNAFDTTFDQPKSMGLAGAGGGGSGGGSHKVFPPSIANSIETNPDLVSCLLKESLSDSKYGSALNAMAAAGGGVNEKPADILAMATTDVNPGPVNEVKNPSQQTIIAPPPQQQQQLQQPQQQQQLKVIPEANQDSTEGHHKSKAEKKKKKEKHKHKEKDKSKDREERKKHKKDKVRDGGEQQEQQQQHKNPVTLKITLPREKGALEGGPSDGGFKIKIPKDRIRADLNAGGGHTGGYEDRMSGMPSVDLMPEKASSSLKIKISKDKIENFSDGTSFAGAFNSAGGGKKKDKDKEKFMKYTM